LGRGSTKVRKCFSIDANVAAEMSKCTRTKFSPVVEDALTFYIEKIVKKDRASMDEHGYRGN